ncbi:FliH/SctL family protein [Parasphingorhabdus cellanae]|uniref:Flagellar assembly protein FliH/Type III secretion system HrpE domain-containing protein n=1 Tax=Parasphingorhabdus cellanae TaxID=2806553 RepID=A0ABX7T3J3_9SPHN|nr:hypothetical protein [Parasphingorhabdus cellanae]QTD56138.1 hypothetical protein J4G78_00575 [Parasphingorhabdus cellanae]
MAYSLFQSPDKALFADKPIIKQADAENISTTIEMLAAAERIKKKYDADRAQAVEEGFAEGRKAALEEMQSHIAAAVLPIANEIADHQTVRQRDLAALAYEAVHHILGAIPEVEKMTALTKRALSNLEIEDVETITLCTGVAEEVKNGLSDNASRLVRADSSLQVHDCIIRTRSGSVLCGLDLQLETLGARWGLKTDVAAGMQGG